MAVAQLSNSSALLRPFCRSKNQQGLSFDGVSCGKTSTCIRFSSIYGYLSTSAQLRHCLSQRSLIGCVLPSDHTAVVDDISLFSEKIEDYVNEGLFEDAIRVYIKRLECGLPVEEFGLLPSLIKAFGSVSDVERARQVHGHVLKLGALEDISVANSILGMYWKCRSADALHLFEKMPIRDGVTWNTMISGLGRAGDYSSSLAVFRHMAREAPSVYPNRVACLSVLSACASVRDLIRGCEIHSYIVKNDMLHDQFLVTALVDMYMKCGDVMSAENVFQRAIINDSVKENPVIWNAMIYGYASSGCIDEALMLLIKMLDSGTKPDSSTVVAALVSCSVSSHLSIGEQIHGLVCRLGLGNDVRVQTNSKAYRTNPAQRLIHRRVIRELEQTLLKGLSDKFTGKRKASRTSRYQDADRNTRHIHNM